MIATNVAGNALSITLAFLVWYRLAEYFAIDPALAKSTRDLIAVLGVLATSQFLFGTLFAASFRSLKEGASIWETWKRDCFSSSMTQVVGAGIAGTIFELINFGDTVTMVVASATFMVVYFTYRQSISEIHSAINKVEDAEREKSDTERDR